jgi:acetolactate synthase-1/2/3 large subunit
MRDRAGLTNIFTLSGNHIMPLFDAAIGTRLNLIHTRHEAAESWAFDGSRSAPGKPRGSR